jgi:potassium-dependent mechanosensitive channel
MSRPRIFQLAVLFLAFLLYSSACGEDFPALTQVGSRAAEITAEAAQVRSRTEILSNTASLESQLELSETRFRQIQERIDQFGDPATWSIERLLETRSVLQGERMRLQRLQQDLTERHEEIERIRLGWMERQEYWRSWEESLEMEGVQYPRERFAQVQQTHQIVLTMVEPVSGRFASLQEEISSLLNENLGLLVSIDSGLRQVRAQTFQRTGHPLFHPEFFRQFDEGLRDEVQQGIGEALHIDMRDFQGQFWILIAQVLLVFAAAVFILRHRRSASEKSSEWDFILNHPWATGIFVSMAAFTPFHIALPPLWSLVLWILFAFSAAVLISALVRNPLKRFTVYLLAAILLASMVLQLIAFPTPLYRLYMASVSLSGIPLFLMLARYNIRRHEGRVNLFSMGLRLGAFICLISFLAQVAGFSTLSARLIDASIRSVFIGIFAKMTVHLGQGVIDYLFSHPFINERAFVQQFGGELSRRLKAIFKVAVWAGALFQIMIVMGIYNNFAQAWDDLTSLGVSVGQVHFTMAMLLLSLLVIYLAMQISWLLRAALDTQVFLYSPVDRGVSDSIKKLLHYFLVLIGFIFAMSLAGIELQNFAVLAGAFGIGIGFGLQNIVNNFVSGLILLFERPIKVGDMVVVGGDWGRVAAIGLRSTVIVTLDGSELIVPNSDLISERVTNWTLTTTSARVVLQVGVAYGSNLELVLRILDEAARNHPLVLSEPAPSAIFVGFGESSLDFELRSWIADVSTRLTVRSELGQFIDRRFREEGVEIPFPQRDLHLRSVDGEILTRMHQTKE